jgi:hypothetical protein
MLKKTRLESLGVHAVIIDSAAGWNLQLSSAIDAMGAWFPGDGAKEIYGQPDSSFGGSFFPSRRAVAVDGGYRREELQIAEPNGKAAAFEDREPAFDERRHRFYPCALQPLHVILQKYRGSDRLRHREESAHWPIADALDSQAIGRGEQKAFPLLKAFKGAILDPNNPDPGEERADECRS